jgi:hypothetical protein
VGQALPCLALLLLPLLAADRAWSRPIVPYGPAVPEPAPYLATVGSPSLRFLEALPPPDLVTRPPASAPPQPSATAEPPKPDVIPFTPPAAEAAAGSPASPASSSRGTPDAEPTGDKSPAPILPDELRPRVHPEDFIPYFQIPAGRPGDPNVIVPVPRSAASPAPLPPSSATYNQSPR